MFIKKVNKINNNNNNNNFISGGFSWGNSNINVIATPTLQTNDNLEEAILQNYEIIESWIESNQQHFSNVNDTIVYIYLDLETFRVSSVYRSHPTYKTSKKNMVGFTCIFSGIGKYTKLTQSTFISSNSGVTSYNNPNISLSTNNLSSSLLSSAIPPSSNQYASPVLSMSPSSSSSTSASPLASSPPNSSSPIILAHQQHSTHYLSTSYNSSNHHHHHHHHHNHNHLNSSEILNNLYYSCSNVKNNIYDSAHYVLVQSVNRALNKLINSILSFNLQYDQIISYKRGEGLDFPHISLVPTSSQPQSLSPISSSPISSAPSSPTKEFENDHSHIFLYNENENIHQYQYQNQHQHPELSPSSSSSIQSFLSTNTIHNISSNYFIDQSKRIVPQIKRTLERSNTSPNLNLSDQFNNINGNGNNSNNNGENTSPSLKLSSPNLLSSPSTPSLASLINGNNQHDDDDHKTTNSNNNNNSSTPSFLTSTTSNNSFLQQNALIPQPPGDEHSPNSSLSLSTSPSKPKVPSQPAKPSLLQSKLITISKESGEPPLLYLNETSDLNGAACMSSLYGWDFEKKEQFGNPFADCFCISLDPHPMIKAVLSVADGSGHGEDPKRAACMSILGSNQYIESLFEQEIQTTNDLLTIVGNSIFEGHKRIIEDDFYKNQEIHLEPKGATTFCIGLLSKLVEPNESQNNNNNNGTQKESSKDYSVEININSININGNGFSLQQQSSQDLNGQNSPRLVNDNQEQFKSYIKPQNTTRKNSRGSSNSHHHHSHHHHQHNSNNSGNNEEVIEASQINQQSQPSHHNHSSPIISSQRIINNNSNNGNLSSNPVLIPSSSSQQQSLNKLNLATSFDSEISESSELMISNNGNNYNGNSMNRVRPIEIPLPYNTNNQQHQQQQQLISPRNEQLKTSLSPTKNTVPPKLPPKTLPPRPQNLIMNNGNNETANININSLNIKDPWVFIVGSVGDTKAYKWSHINGKVTEITNRAKPNPNSIVNSINSSSSNGNSFNSNSEQSFKMSSSSSRNFNDAGGQLGWMWGGDQDKSWPLDASSYPGTKNEFLRKELLKARNEKCKPLLTNLHFAMSLVVPGDRIFIVSDGVSDNFLSENPDITPSINPSSKQRSIREQIEDNMTKFLNSLPKESIETCESMSQSLITHCIENTEPFRNLQEETSKLLLKLKEIESHSPNDFTKDPLYQTYKKQHNQKTNALRKIKNGKPDHSSIVIYQVPNQ